MSSARVAHAAAYLVHAGMQPFEVTGLVDEIIESRLDIVVLSLSEYDTHRPMNLSARTAAGSFSALYALARVAGPGFAVREQVSFLRLSLAAFLQSYRFRVVERAAGLADLLAFSRPGIDPPRAADAARYVLGADGGPGYPVRQEPQGLTVHGMPFEVYSRVLDDMAERFPELSSNACRAQLNQILSISLGVHADVQLALLRGAVSRLTAAGIDVVLFQLPLQPSMSAFYDPSTSAAFVEFARSLDENEQVHFVSLSLGSPFLEDEFIDMTHVTNARSKRLSAALASELLRVAEARGTRGR